MKWPAMLRGVPPDNLKEAVLFGSNQSVNSDAAIVEHKLAKQ